MGENPLLEELYSRLGLPDDSFEEFTKNFYNSENFREVAYERVGLSKEGAKELDNMLMMSTPGGISGDPQQKMIPSEEDSVNPPATISAQPIKNEPITLEFFGGSKNGKIDIPVSDREGGVEIQKVRSDGEFGVPIAKDDGYYVDYKVKNYTDETDPKSKQALGFGFGSLIPKQEFTKNYEVYLGPTNEFAKAYDDLSTQEKKVYFEYDDDFKDKVKKASLLEFHNKMGLTEEDEVEYVIRGDSNPNDFYLAERVLQKYSNKTVKDIGLAEQSLASKYPSLFAKVADIDDEIEAKTIRKRVRESLEEDTSDIDRELKDLYDNRASLLNNEVEVDGIMIPFGELPEMQLKEEMNVRLGALQQQYLETYQGSNQQRRDRTQEDRRKRVNAELEKRFDDGIPFNYGVTKMSSLIQSWWHRTAGNYIGLAAAITGSENLTEKARDQLALGRGFEGSVNSGGIQRKELELKDGNIAVLDDNNQIIAVEDPNGFDVSDDLNEEELYNIGNYVEANKDKIKTGRWNLGRIGTLVGTIGLDLAPMLLPGMVGAKIGERVLLTAARSSAAFGERVLAKEVGSAFVNKAAKNVLKKSVQSGLSQTTTGLSVYAATFGNNYIEALDNGLDPDEAAWNASQKSFVEATATIMIGGIESRLTGGVLNKINKSKLKDALRNVITGKISTREAVNSIAIGVSQFVKDNISEVIEENLTNVAQSHIDYLDGIGDGTVSEKEYWDTTVGTVGLTMFMSAGGSYNKGRSYRTRRQGDLRPVIAQGMIENIDDVIEQVDYVANALKNDQKITKEQRSSIKEELRAIKDRYDALPENLSNADKQAIAANEIGMMEADMHIYGTPEKDVKRGKIKRKYFLENQLITNQDSSIEELKEIKAELIDLYKELYGEVPSWIVDVGVESEEVSQVEDTETQETEILPSPYENIEVNSESKAVLDGEPVKINVDEKGNIVSLETDKGEFIEDEKTLVAVEIERNKIAENPEMDEYVRSLIEDDQVVEFESELVESDPDIKTINVALNENMSDSVSDAMDKLYENEELTEQEHLQIELWTLDAVERLDKLKENNPNLSEKIDAVREGIFTIDRLNNRKQKADGKEKVVSQPTTQDTRQRQAETNSQEDQGKENRQVTYKGKNYTFTTDSNGERLTWRDEDGNGVTNLGLYSSIQAAYDQTQTAKQTPETGQKTSQENVEESQPKEVIEEKPTQEIKEEKQPAKKKEKSEQPKKETKKKEKVKDGTTIKLVKGRDNVTQDVEYTYNEEKDRWENPNGNPIRGKTVDKVNNRLKAIEESPKLPENLNEETKYGKKEITFENDLDKAAYVVTKKGDKVNRDPYYKFANENGVSNQELNQRGGSVREQVKSQVDQANIYIEDQTSELDAEKASEPSKSKKDTKTPKTKENVTEQSESNKTTASLNIAPLYSVKIESEDQLEAMVNTDLYKKYKKDIVDLASEFDINVLNTTDGIGAYHGDTEVSTVIEVEGDFDRIVEFAALMGALTPEVQDSTIAGKIIEPNSENHNADRITIGIDNDQSAMRAAEESGFKEGGYTLAGGEIYFFKIFDYPIPNFDKKITTFTKKYIEYGGQITNHRRDSLRSEYIDSGRRREILGVLENNALLDRQNRSSLHNAIQDAKRRNEAYVRWKEKAKKWSDEKGRDVDSDELSKYKELRTKQLQFALEGKELSKSDKKQIKELESFFVEPLIEFFAADEARYKKAKEEVETIADEIASIVKDSFVSEFTIKKPSRAAIKSVRWYGAQGNYLGDGSRTNIIVNTNQDADFLFDELSRRYNIEGISRVENEITELGYPKRLIEVYTPSGKLAEIQVMTPEGYLAKDGLKWFPKDQKKFGKEQLDIIQNRVGYRIPDGVGHYFYEIERDTNIPKTLRDEATELSKRYYDLFLNPDSEVDVAKFRSDIKVFRNKVDKADKSGWDEGNNAVAPETLQKFIETPLVALNVEIENIDDSTPKGTIEKKKAQIDIVEKEIKNKQEQVEDIEKSKSQEERRKTNKEILERPSIDELNPDKSRRPVAGDRVINGNSIVEVIKIYSDGSYKLRNRSAEYTSTLKSRSYKGIVSKNLSTGRLHISQTEIDQSKRGIAEDILSFFSNMKGVGENIIVDTRQTAARLSSLGYTTIEAFADLKRLTPENIPEEPIKTEDGFVYGLYDPSTNKIYLDPRFLNPETTIEEIIHMQQKAIKAAAANGDVRAKSILNQLNSLLGGEVDAVIKGNKDGKGLKRSVFGISLDSYAKMPNETNSQYRERLIEEAWAKIMTPTAIEKFKAEKKNRLVGAFNKIKNWFLDSLGIDNKKAPANPTINDLMELLSDDLLKGSYFDNLNTSKANEDVLTEEDRRRKLIEEIADLRWILNEKGHSINSIEANLERIKRINEIKNNPIVPVDDEMKNTPVEDRKHDKKATKEAEKRIIETVQKYKEFRDKLEKAYRNTSKMKGKNTAYFNNQVDQVLDIYTGVAEYWAGLEKGRTPEMFFTDVIDDINFNASLNVKGRARKISPDKWAISLGKEADQSTLMHELAHVFEQLLTDGELKQVAEWSKGPNAEWIGNTKEKEAFADGFLTYLYLSDSKHPIANIFAKFADFISSLVDGIVRQQVERGNPYLSDAMKDIYTKVTSNRLELATGESTKKASANNRKKMKKIQKEEFQAKNREFKSILESVIMMSKTTHEFSGFRTHTIEQLVKRAYNGNMMDIDNAVTTAETKLYYHGQGIEYGSHGNDSISIDEAIGIAYVTQILKERYDQLLFKNTQRKLTGEEVNEFDQLKDQIEVLTKLAMLDGSSAGRRLGIRAHFFRTDWADNFDEVFEMHSEESLVGHKDEKKIRNLLNEYRSNKALSDELKKNADDMAVKAMVAEGDEVVHSYKSTWSKIYDFFKGLSTIQKTIEGNKSVKIVNEIDGNDIDSEVLNQTDYNDEEKKLKEQQKRRNHIRRFAISVLSNPEEYGSVNTFIDLYKIVSSKIPSLTKLDLFDSLKTASKTEIDGRKVIIESQKRNVQREIKAFEELRNLIEGEIGKLKTGNYKALNNSKESLKIKRLVDQIRYAAAVSDEKISDAAYNEAINNLSGILTHYENAIASLNDPKINVDNLREISIANIKSLFEAYEEVRSKKRLENRIAKLNEKLSDLDTDNYSYVDEFIRNNNNESDYYDALQRAKTALKDGKITESMQAIEDQRNIYKIINEAFNIITTEEVDSFEDVVDQIKETLENTGHSGITKKSILHALYQYESPKKITDEITDHRAQIKKTGKLINDVIRIVSGKNILNNKSLEETTDEEMLSNVQKKRHELNKIMTELKDLAGYGVKDNKPLSIYLESQIANIESQLKDLSEGIAKSMKLDIGVADVRTILANMSVYANEVQSKKLDLQFEEILKNTERLKDAKNLSDLDINDFKKVPGLIERHLTPEIITQNERNNEQRKINTEKVKNLILSNLKDRIKNDPNKEVLEDLRRVIDYRTEVKSKNAELVDLEGKNIALKQKLREYLDQNSKVSIYGRISEFTNAPRLLVLAADVSFILYQGALGIPFMAGQFAKDLVPAITKGDFKPIKNTAFFNVYGKTIATMASMFDPGRPNTKIHNALKPLVGSRSKSSEVYAKTLAELQADPLYQLMIKSGLILSNPLNAQLEEELNLTTFFERIPFIKNPIKFIRHFSERGYSVYMNTMRMEMFKEGKRILEKKATSQQALEEGLVEYAEYVNTVTGAAQKFTNIKRLDEGFNSALDTFRHIFISPRLYASTFKSMGAMGWSAIKSPVVYAEYRRRKSLAESGGDRLNTLMQKVKLEQSSYESVDAFKSYVDFTIALHHFRAASMLGVFLAGMGAAGAAAYARGLDGDDEEEYKSAFWQEYINPFSSNFLKVKFGTNVFTVAPLANYYRFVLRTMGKVTRQFAGEKYLDSAAQTLPEGNFIRSHYEYAIEKIRKREEEDETIQKAAGQFLNWKVNPSISAFINTMLYNRDFLGRPVSNTPLGRIGATITQGFTPIAVQGIIQNIQKGITNPKTIASEAAIDFMGINAYSQNDYSDVMVANYRTNIGFRASYKIGKKYGNEGLRGTTEALDIVSKSQNELGSWLRTELSKGNRPSKREMEGEWFKIIKKTWDEADVKDEDRPSNWR